MTITATKLRADLYRVIDNVIKNGVSVEVELRGKKVRIVPAEPRDKLAALVKRPGVIIGDSGRSSRRTGPGFGLDARRFRPPDRCAGRP